MDSAAPLESLPFINPTTAVAADITVLESDSRLGGLEVVRENIGIERGVSK